MSVVSHVYPSDMYRAAALQGYIARGFGYKEAVELAIKAADLMTTELEKHTDYDIE